MLDGNLFNATSSFEMPCSGFHCSDHELGEGKSKNRTHADILSFSPVADASPQPHLETCVALKISLNQDMA